MEFNIFSFPLEQIGWGLRQLSLSGTIGNIVAIILYLLIGVVPCGIFFYIKKKGMNRKIDYLLFGMSGILFVVLYYMINPGLLAMTMLGSGKVMLGGAFYSVLVGYLVLRMIGFGLKDKVTDLATLQKTIRIVLCMVMFLFICSAGMEFFVNLPANLQALEEANSISGVWDEFMYGTLDLTMTKFFLMLQAVVHALPYGLSAVIVFWCIKALEELLRESYSEKAVMMVHKVTQLCSKSLVAVVTVGVLFNLAQLVCSNQLYQMHITINIPVFSILFMLVIHMLAKYIEENQKLKEDNELFI